MSQLSRNAKRSILVIFDFVILSTALWSAYIIRVGELRWPATIDELALIFAAPLIAFPIFVRMGLYRAVIRFLSERALWTILQAVTFAVISWVVLVYILGINTRAVLPRTVPFIYWALAALSVGGSRFLVKNLLAPVYNKGTGAPPVIVYGAGESGAQLATAMHQYEHQAVVAFVDDNPSIVGRDVAGVRVYSSSRLGLLIEQFGVQEIILSMPSVGGTRRQEIVASVSALGVRIRTLPPINDLVSGKYLVSQVREIDIDELLGRSSVPADPELIKTMVEGRTIMITGAGGSIGSELCRLIARSSPQRLVLFEANEFALYQIDKELQGVTDLVVVPVLGSVISHERVSHAIQNHGVTVVFHAAAHKHVPLVESNALEGIGNNVFGTLNVVQTSFECGVKNFVLISTDKAVRPTNVMGATKRWAELIVRQKAVESKAAKTGQKFSAVRFGNVLGSNGSVVPLFKEQIARGGPLTLTDPRMTRYFMSIHEAAELIIQAGALAQGGDVFLLDMGDPILIGDLASNMIRLTGLSVKSDKNPQGDIEIIVTGKRPGEKMFEEMFYDPADARTTQHAKIMRGPSADTKARSIAQALDRLKEAVDNEDEQAARRILFEFIK